VKLAECLAFLREGDVLTVTEPDRLARSTAELLSIEADLSKRGIGLVVLSMGGERSSGSAHAGRLLPRTDTAARGRNRSRGGSESPHRGMDRIGAPWSAP
jgi:hypothetical protein